VFRRRRRRRVLPDHRDRPALGVVARDLPGHAEEQHAVPPRLPGPPHDVQRRASPREVLQRHPRHARAVVVAGVVELLNPRQVDAVQHRPLPLLVVAHLQHVEAGGPPLLVGVPDHLQPAAGLADVGVHPPGVEPALGPQPRRQRHLAQLPAVDGEAEEARRQHRPHQRAVPEDATRVAEPRERAAAAAAVVPDRRAPRTCPGGVDADAVVPARDDPVLVPRLQRLPREKVAEPVGLFTFLLSSTMEALPIFMQEQEILAKEISLGIYSMTSSTVVFLPFQLALTVEFTVVVYWMAGLRSKTFGYFVVLVWLMLYKVNSEGIAVKRYVG
ncbi:Os02g0630100, partial [Oryza sativa Japonica Group]